MRDRILISDGDAAVTISMTVVAVVLILVLILILILILILTYYTSLVLSLTFPSDPPTLLYPPPGRVSVGRRSLLRGGLPREPQARHRAAPLGRRGDLW